MFRRLEEERLGQLQAMAALYLQVNIVITIVIILVTTIVIILGILIVILTITSTQQSSSLWSRSGDEEQPNCLTINCANYLIM